MTTGSCSKCKGRLMYEVYPVEDMLVHKCFVCGKINSYRELTRAQAQQLFRRIDRTLSPVP